MCAILRQTCPAKTSRKYPGFGRNIQHSTMHYNTMPDVDPKDQTVKTPEQIAAEAKQKAAADAEAAAAKAPAEPAKA